MTALLIVRATIPDLVDRPLFDAWYQNEHVPDAYRDLRPDRAWRAWSKTDPSIHYAFYELSDVEGVERALASAAIKLLIKEFDRVWGNRVTRTREVVEVVQRFPNSN